MYKAIKIIFGSIVAISGLALAAFSVWVALQPGLWSTNAFFWALAVFGFAVSFAGVAIARGARVSRIVQDFIPGLPSPPFN